MLHGQPVAYVLAVMVVALVIAACRARPWLMRCTA